MAASGPKPKLGTLSTALTQSGNVVTPALQYSTANYKVDGMRGKKPTYNRLETELGYNDKGLSGGINWVNTSPVNKNLSFFSDLGLGYNHDNVEGASFNSKLGANINLLNSKMTRPGDTRLSINPYAHATFDKNTLSDDPNHHNKIGYGVSADFRTMLGKNLSVFGEAGVDATVKDLGRDMPLNPYGNVGISYNLDGARKLLYKKPAYKPKSKDNPNPRLTNSNKTPEFTRDFGSNPRF
jgi:hypothetical protein